MKTLFLLLFVPVTAFLLWPFAALAEESGITITDYNIPGDGATPTFLQHLDTQAPSAKEAHHLASATARGDVVFSFELLLPPALLKPSLSLNYSSEARMDKEMAYGWKLSGIPEISRPLARAFSLKDKSEWYSAEWLTSGPGFSGTLKPSGNSDYRFYLSSSQPIYAIANYDPTANTWTMTSGGLSMTLTAADEGASSQAGTALWRASEVADTAGNFITYCYDGDGLIQSIAYGGNRDTGEEHLITVAFAYGDNAVTRTSARTGSLTEYAKHIEKITIQSGGSSDCANTGSITRPTSTSSISGKTETKTVKKTAYTTSTTIDTTVAVPTDTDDEEDSENRLYAFDIVTEQRDDLDLLVSLEREGASSLSAEVIAEFDYTAFDDTAGSTGTAPASLGESRFRNKAGDTPYSSTTKIWQDFNRDGLADVVDASADDVESTKEWQITSQSVNHEARNFGWNDAEAVEVYGGTPEYDETEESDGAYNRALTSRQTLDLDGDGYLDVVVSGTTPWTVYYGKGDVEETPSIDWKATSSTIGTTEVPPDGVLYSQESWRLNADHDDAADVTTDGLYGFLDFNGDGWQDIVLPADRTVWLHAGTRGGGWPSSLTLTPTAISAMRSVHYTLKASAFEIDAEDFCAKLGAPILKEDDSGEDYPCAEPSGDCTQYASAICEAYLNTSLAVLSISFTDEISGFRDINGDGLLDYVIADTLPWQVYLNTGYDLGIDGEAMSWDAPVKYMRRVNEGSPYKYWEDISVHYTYSAEGLPTRVYQEILDVDGDGLVDLAIGTGGDTNENGYADGDEISQERVWFKNTGGGFATTPEALPEWWPNEFTASYATSDVANDDEDAVGSATTTAMTMDINHDGVVDYVTIAWHEDDEGEAEVGTDSVTFGSYPPPHFMKEIRNGHGGTTTIDYRSLATVAPSGEWGTEKKTPNIKHLADEINSVDGFTGQNAQTSFSYENGNFTDGLFQGFEARTVTRQINAVWSSKSVNAYELSRDFDPLVTSDKLYVDANLTFGSTIKRGTAIAEKLRYETENTYADVGDPANLRLLSARKVTEYGEESGAKITKSAKTSHTYTWDSFGNLTEYDHDGGGDTDDAITVSMTYANDNATAPTFHRMATKTLTGTDPISGTEREFEQVSYLYDDNANPTDLLTKGWLTGVKTSAGYVNGGEAIDSKSLEITYTPRGPRGELTAATETETGITVNQTFDFGGAVLAEQTNGLGHKITREIDDRGRVTSIRDSNGLKTSFDYDAFDRVTKKNVIGTDGKTHTDIETEFSRSTEPYYDAVTYYDKDGGVEAKMYTVQDGFSKPAITWIPDVSGNYLATTEIFDVRGLSTRKSHPESMGSSFSPPTASMGIVSTLRETYHDALGIAREIVGDASHGTGPALVYFDSPRVELTQDAAGYQKKLTYDAHHRLIKVEEGKADAYTTTAEYGYDPAGRLVTLEDGGSTCYAYLYDGAGRLREVMHGSTSEATAVRSHESTLSRLFDFVSTTARAATISGTSTVTVATAPSRDCTAATPWHSYEYKGLLMTRAEDAAGGYVKYEHDAIGRVVKTTASDGLPSATEELVYEIDYDDAWTGGVFKTTDPAGTTEYGYDEFGRVNAAQRTYEARTASFSYDIDFRGHMTTKTFPSGGTVTGDYDYSYLAKMTATFPGATAYDITYGYNKWGFQDSAISTLGHNFTTTFTTPLWLDEVAYSFGAKEYKRKYTWLDNGLLSERTEEFDGTAYTFSTSGASKGGGGSRTASTSPLSIPYDFAYDDLRQLSLITSEGATVESYAFDAAGNPTTVQDAAGAMWTFDAPGSLNQIATGTSDTGQIESFTFDAAGRVKTRTSSTGTEEVYYYDGFGRLRGSTNDGDWVMVLDYDVDGNLVRRGDNSSYYDYTFRDWRYDEKTGMTTEFETPLTATQTAADGTVSRLWLFKEFDGHATMTFDDAGVNQSQRTFGGFGAILNKSGTTWDFNSFHGVEERNGLFHMGRRHLLPGFGQWLQPEPLLYEGLPADGLADPLNFATRRYARNTPTVFRDPSGNQALNVIIILNTEEDAFADGELSFEEYMQGGLNYLEESLQPENLVLGLVAGVAANAATNGVVKLYQAMRKTNTAGSVVMTGASSAGSGLRAWMNEMRGLEGVNPSGCKINCNSVAFAQALRLTGEAPGAVAKKMSVGESPTLTQFLNQFPGKTAIQLQSKRDVDYMMGLAGDGSVGIVGVTTADPMIDGHVFTVANNSGTINYYNSGGVYDKLYTNYYLFPWEW